MNVLGAIHHDDTSESFHSPAGPSPSPHPVPMTVTISSLPALSGHVTAMAQMATRVDVEALGANAPPGTPPG